MASLQLLSAREVQAAGDGDHSDGGGLVLRVRGSNCSWVLRYTSPTGRRRHMGLGPAYRANTKQAGESVSTAREAAWVARDLLARGVDPIDERDRKREAGRQAEEEAKALKQRERWTLARCAREYHERVIEPSRSVKHAAQWIASLEHHVPKDLWDKPIADIEAPELLTGLCKVRSLEDKKTAIPETLQRIRQRLDAVFEDACFHKRCVSNPAAALHRKLQESQKRRERGNFKALPYRQAPAFMAELRRAEGTAARCLELLLLTAARTSEVLLAEWSEFDREAALWVIPGSRMKAGEDHVVHLTSRALAILEGQAGQDKRFVFPTPMESKKGKPMSNMAMLTVLDRMGYRDRTTVHGLRSTFSTWANETAAARPDVIEACLAHEESNRVRAAYNRAEFAEERLALLAAWADYLARQPAAVVPLRAA